MIKSGIGPKKSFELIHKYGSIEEIIKHLDKKYQVPENFPFEAVRDLFKNPEVTDPATIEVFYSIFNFKLLYLTLIFILFLLHVTISLHYYIVN
jgi:5'-3' exonuclease